VVHATQQELADAVGTVREVVTRTLRGLREEGKVETRRDEIILLDPVALGDELSGLDPSP
jgi:CRP/FNR family transcriptional regulator